MRGLGQQGPSRAVGRIRQGSKSVLGERIRHGTVLRERTRQGFAEEHRGLGRALLGGYDE